MYNMLPSANLEQNSSMHSVVSNATLLYTTLNAITLY